MKKFIKTNEESVAKQDAEIRRLASLIRRMDDDVRSRRPVGGLWSFHEPVRTASRDWRPHALKINHCEVDTTRVDRDAPRRPSRSGRNMIP